MFSKKIVDKLYEHFTVEERNEMRQEIATYGAKRASFALDQEEFPSHPFPMKKGPKIFTDSLDGKFKMVNGVLHALVNDGPNPTRWVPSSIGPSISTQHKAEELVSFFTNHDDGDPIP